MNNSGKIELFGDCDKGKDGEWVDVETDDVEFRTGKYEGQLLSEVVDVGYLKWMLKAKPDDHLIKLMVGKRLKELE